MLIYRNLNKGNISATEMKCISDALLVKAENRTLQETNLLIKMDDASDITSHHF
jgi:hypothetical protein